MRVRDKEKEKKVKDTKGQLGIIQKIEREMKRLRQIIRKGSIRMRCTVEVMYDYRKRRDRKKVGRIAELSFFFPHT